MNILLRADASITIGSGHIMRSATLAHALTRQGYQCNFICADTTGNMIDWLKQNFTVFTIPATENETTDAEACLLQLNHNYDLLIVDHYQLAKTWHQLMRAHCRHIMVIDDLADRVLDCDILLNQNLLPDLPCRYKPLLPEHCSLLTGPSYALLRDEFYLQNQNTERQKLLVFFGGSDAENLTGQALSAISMLKDLHIEADIVIGSTNPWRAELEQQLACLPNAQLHIQCDYMAKLMHQARLMLGTGGASHWERCICALPGLIVTVAENQQLTTAYLTKLGVCAWLGQAAEMSAGYFAEQLRYYLSQPALLDNMALSAGQIVPKMAGTPNVITEISTLLRGTDV